MQEIDAILKQFRDWLAQTAEQVDALDSSAATETSSAMSTEAQQEKPNEKAVQFSEIEAVKDHEGPENFTACVLSPTAWTEKITQFDETVSLDRAAETGQPKKGCSQGVLGTDVDSLPEESGTPLPEIGLRQLVEAFTAMRHETKLQTKSSRGLVEAVQSSLAGLDATIRQFQKATQTQKNAEQGKEAREKEVAQRSAEEFAVPLIEALVELDEAMLRGAKAFEATTRSASDRLERRLDQHFLGLSWWYRWTARFWHRQIRRVCIEAMEQIYTEDFSHLKEGYALIRGRFQRVLRKHDVHRIESIGRPVDPETMNVVELVNSSKVEPETVVEEVRPGYQWRDRVIRFAEVRAACGR